MIPDVIIQPVGQCPHMYVYRIRNNSKYSDRCFWTNSAGPDQTAPKEQSDQALHCLALHLFLFFDITALS